MPGRDWSTDKAERVLSFLQNEGRAIFILGYQSERFVNLDNVLSAYGIGIGDYLVLEGDTNRFYMGNPGFIIPTFVPSEITQPLIDRRFVSLLVQTTAIDELTLVRSSTSIEPIMLTSPASYGKNNPEAASINKEPGDLEGPFALGVKVDDTWYTHEAHTTKLIAFSCEFILEESINDMIGGTNWDLIINSLHWLSEQPVSIQIPSKSPSRVSPLSMSQGQANTIAFISVIALPLIFVGTGVFVWFRRRHN
jgi:ABC-2 type transport system permease protein